ncbi:gluconokinase [Gordonia sp. SID5947]|uniref:gluconokinase n=1 Tax=Gordonia sp. SID5947 TaxID=2690315 RepID=UPI00136C0436|nr:gluconokinase [Gordonia sp. SID5947]MYR07892.1 gluconokinase [Gordonia sp. SID5947]
MGVSGCGKSTVGRALADRLDVPFVDGDDLHPESNIAKMAAGHPLDDADRLPWLDEVGTWLADHADGGVASCSALRRAYRDVLRAHEPTVWFLHLDGSADLIARRQAHRPGHFMPASLLTSQFATLQPLGDDEQGLTADVARDVDDLVAAAVETLRRRD